MAETTTAPAPRLTSRGRATRARILAAAADLILRNGVAGTQIDDVRKAAGVSGSQMTHYFRDKRHLIEDVIAWQARAVLERHTQAPPGRPDSFEALRRWARLELEGLQAAGFEGGCRFGSLAGQLVESDQRTRAILADGFEKWLELLREGLVAMRDRGDLRRDADPEALAHILLAAVQGGTLLSQTLRRAEPLRDALDAALTHVESFAAAGR